MDFKSISNVEKAFDFIEKLLDVASKLIRVPTIAAMAGHAAGFFLAIACDTV